MSVRIVIMDCHEKAEYARNAIADNCDGVTVDMDKTTPALIVEIDASPAHPDILSKVKIILRLDGSWDIEHDYDDGRDPYDRDMREPYEP